MSHIHPPPPPTFGSRLRYLREKKRLRQSDVARAVGMSQGNYSNLERDAYPGGTTFAPSLAAYFDCDIAWLVGPDLVTQVTPAKKVEQFSNNTQSLRTIPLLQWHEYANYLVTGKSENTVPAVGKFSSRTFAAVHRGLSMAGPQKPVIPDGAVLIVDPSVTPAPNRTVACLIAGEAHVGTLAEYAGKRLLVPSNPQFPTLDITADTIIGEVVAVQVDPHV